MKVVITLILTFSMVVLLGSRASADPTQSGDPDWECSALIGTLFCNYIYTEWQGDNPGYTGSYGVNIACSGCFAVQDSQGVYSHHDCPNKDNIEFVQTGNSQVEKWEERSIDDPNGVQTGSAVWDFQTCFRQWTCADRCDATTATPFCVALSKYSIGKYKPADTQIPYVACGFDGL